MRRLFVLMAVILISTTLAFAEGPPPGVPAGAPGQQGHDDHDDNGPVRAGYAVVTPTMVTTSGATGGTTVTAGLAVFGTYGLRSMGGDSAASQAAVVPPGLTTNALLFVDAEGRLSKNLGVALVNPNSSSVNVNLTLRKADGSTVAIGTMGVPSHQQVSKMVTELFSSPSSIPSDVVGTL